MKRSPLRRGTKQLKRSQMNKKPRKGDKPKLRTAYMAEHLACCICWSRLGQFGVDLECHHIIGGSGRKDELCNLAALCRDCHWQHTHGGMVDEQGKRWPALTTGMILTAKREADVENFDLARLCVLEGRAVGALECEEIHEFYLRKREGA